LEHELETNRRNGEEERFSFFLEKRPEASAAVQLPVYTRRSFYGNETPNPRRAKEKTARM
jgi:hypothetical protein